MKRFTLDGKVVVTESAMRLEWTQTVISVMKEDAGGEWVRWSDVEKLREFLEGQIPEYRIAKLEKALGLVHEGKCPECEQPVRGLQVATRFLRAGSMGDTG